MTHKKPTMASSSQDSWPVVWRIVLLEGDGEASIVDEVECEEFACRRAAELREFGWPVRLERIAREPLPPGTPSLESARRKLRDLKRSTDS